MANEFNPFLSSRMGSASINPGPAASSVDTPPAPPPGKAVVAPPAAVGEGSSVRSALSLRERIRNIDTRAILPEFNVPEDRFVPRFTGSQTMTKLAQSSLVILNRLTREELMMVLNTVVNKGVSPSGLMDALEQGVKFNEVMSEVAEGWSKPTKDNFVRFFGMPAEQLPVMDGIVSTAILNDPTLESQLRRENTPAPTSDDLLDGRRILYQYPPPGSVLEPPYVVLLAIEHTDAQVADNVIGSVLGELTDYKVKDQVFRLIRSAVQKLG